jgi:hypothetical protein
MDVVCSGAGAGELTDACRLRLLDALVGSTIYTEEDIRSQIETVLVAFHQSDVYKKFPGKAEAKYIAGLIGGRTAQREVFLFEFFNTVVKPVEAYGLAGEDYVFLERIVKRRVGSKSLSINQAAFLGIEVVSEAKEISTTVGGPIRVVIATPDGIREEESARVKWTEDHITTQNGLIDDLRLELSSTGVQVQDQLRTFSNSITSVRGVYGSKYPAWPKPTLLPDHDDDPTTR